MKRAISAILASSMIFGMSSTILSDDLKAKEDSQEMVSVETEGIFEYNGHGEFTKSESVSLSRNQIISNSVDNLNNGGIITASPTNDTDLYKIDEEKYLSRAYDDTFLLVDKIDVNIDNFSENDDVFTSYHISERAQQEMQEIISAQKELGNEEFSIEIYAPGEQKDGVMPMADAPLGTRYYNYYSSVYGRSFDMMDYSIKYKMCYSDRVEMKGSSCLEYAKKTSNIVVSAIGVVSTVVSIVGTLMSIYDFYKEEVGSVGSSRDGDEISARLYYDRIFKETYTKDYYGEFSNPGCISHKVWLDEIYIDQIYQSIGRRSHKEQSINKELFSENFLRPCEVSISNGMGSIYLDDHLRTRLLNRTCVLNGRSTNVVYK